MQDDLEEGDSQFDYPEPYIQQDYSENQFYYPEPDNGVMQEEQPATDFEDTAEVEVHYQNGWDQPLQVECSDGFGIYSAESVHDNHREDRRWQFDCKRVSLYIYIGSYIY